jgi:hypothetical protein
VLLVVGFGMASAILPKTIEEFKLIDSALRIAWPLKTVVVGTGFEPVKA